MKSAFSYFSTSFLKTSFIIGFNLICCSIEVLAIFSKRILCMQMEGLIPFKSSIDQAIASLYFLRVSSSFCSSNSVNAAKIIIGFVIFGSKKAYFN